MQLLIGYLVALAVFLGGGYAGIQWLLTPDDSAALAQNSRAESAPSRLINAKKIRDARALHRRLAESLAEGPAVALKASEALAESGEASDETIRDMAGHVSKQMLKHYSHIRTQAKRRAVDSLVAAVKADISVEPAKESAKVKESGEPTKPLTH